tara:strand:- start:813 stop:1607 length:795 start_codon:yes stop_codon:yes gene_type:complete
MKKYLVIGNPISHSLSPQVHNFWMKNNNINGYYEKKKLRSNELKDLIFKVKNKEIDGINVTVPFKKEVIKSLDQLSNEANKTQSVNTIFLKNNKLFGHNTDIEGFKLAIKESKFHAANKKILILGAGGVVPSIIFALNDINVSKIFISNRTREKAENLQKIFNNLEICSWGTIPDFDIVINATSLGLNSDDEIKLDFSNVGKNKLFFDVIYNPKETKFLKTGKALGNQIENGKMMFIYQALAAFKIWHGIEPKVDKETINLVNQ